jgi:hypothetical protein
MSEQGAEGQLRRRAAAADVAPAPAQKAAPAPAPAPRSAPAPRATRTRVRVRTVPVPIGPPSSIWAHSALASGLMSGGASGASGTGFAAPYDSAPFQNPINQDQINQNASQNPESAAYLNNTGNLPGIAPGQNRIPSDSELQTLYGSNASPDQLSQDYAQDFNIRAACD